jgi:hypothetical protein
MAELAKWCIASERTAADRLNREGLEAVLPSAQQLRASEESFFATRGILYDRSPDAWLNLNVPYQPLWNVVRDHSAETLIVTHKNRAAVLALCRHYQLPVTEDSLYSGDSGLSKTLNITKLVADYPAEQYYFIDDNFRNLIELQADIDGLLPVKLFYATWGYGSEQDALDAVAAGIPAMTQESVITLMEEEGFLPSPEKGE